MVHIKVIYIITVIITAFIVVMYPGSVPPVLLGLELCMAGCSLLFLFLLLPGFRLSVTIKKQIVFAQEEWSVPITVRNNSYLPIPHMRMRVMIHNHMNQQKDIRDIFLKLPKKSRVSTDLIMKSDFCGVVEIQIQSCRIYEPFCLFGWTKRKLESYEQVVLPRLIEVDVKITDQNRYFIGDSEEYDSKKPGEDPSEVLRFREYMQGDRMSQINWKMSARKDTLLVKEYSFPLDCTTELIIDTRYTSLKQADALLTTVYSISWALIQQNFKHRICWYEDGTIVTYVVSKEEELLEIMKQLMLVPAQISNWKLQAWEERRQEESMYEQILLTGSICLEEAEFIFSQQYSRKQVIFLIQEEERKNQEVKEQYEENCYEIHVQNIENELPSIELQI